METKFALFHRIADTFRDGRRRSDRAPRPTHHAVESSSATATCRTDIQIRPALAPLVAAVSLLCFATSAAADDSPQVRGTDCQRVPLIRDFELVYSDAETAIYTLDNGTDLGFGGPAPDVLSLEFYFAGVGVSGTFDLGQGPNGNYNTCTQCLLVGQDAEVLFFQSAGTLSIDPATPTGSETLQLQLNNARVVEVTIDPDTFATTPVPGGACYDHVDNVMFANGFE